MNHTQSTKAESGSLLVSEFNMQGHVESILGEVQNNAFTPKSSKSYELTTQKFFQPFNMLKKHINPPHLPHPY